jgi:Tol biopolymer transport system component
MSAPLCLALIVSAPARPESDRAPRGTFLVWEGAKGLGLLAPDGEEKERLTPRAFMGAFSPDGDWLAVTQLDPGATQGRLVIQSRSKPIEHARVPLLWGTSGTSCSLVWAPDSKRLLIGEEHSNQNFDRERAFRVWDIPGKGLSDLNLPKEAWVTGWSADGKRLLATYSVADDNVRIAWIKVDGTGEPECITSENEVAYRGQLSPDGGRIICMIGPRAANSDLAKFRLNVIDLATKKRTIVDEEGHTSGHCWSEDGKKIAYTWQPRYEKPAEVSMRETRLITCDADGTNRKTVTSRKYDVPENSSGRNGIIYFFEVRGWR